MNTTLSFGHLFGETDDEMQAPWPKLKQTEIETPRQLRNGTPRKATLSRLRKLVTECGQYPGAEECVCYHGSLALLFEFEQKWAKALRHREVEIRKIRRLYELEQ